MPRSPKQLLAFAILIGFFGVASFTLACGSAPPVPQPIAFPHKTHVDADLDCTYCHSTADRSIAATIPSVSECMICHISIIPEHPEVQKVAAFADRGEEIPWARVYGFPTRAAVHFTHKRHIKAGVECSVCHGNVGEAMVIRAEVNWTMGRCIDCHLEKQVSVDCVICHK
jgi:hypothetical protein